MSDFVLSPNMSLPVPIVGQDPGPTYASDLNACLSLLDSHDHSAGAGVQITPSGLNINADLTIQNFNLTNIKTLRLFNQISPIAGSAPNLGVLYRAGADLYYNDGSGNQIAITTSGSVNAGAGSITGLPSGTASASFAAGTFTWRSATNKAATMDMGGLIIRESGVTSANGVSLISPTALASSYSLTLLAALPGSTQALNITSGGNMGTISYDAIGQAMTATGANAIQVTTTRATGTSVGTGGIAISASSGAFSALTGAAPIDVTNLSVTITTSGRPVCLKCIPDGNTAQIARFQVVDFVSSQISPSSIALFQWKLFRDATVIAYGEAGGTLQVIVDATDSSISLTAYTPPSAVETIDAVVAGTYTYKVQIFLINGDSIFVGYMKLVAYEL